jgi:hypothetical protein
MFRHLVPCDPVVTVAPDVVFFECFAKDESSYGCLSVERDAFRGEGTAGLGTTNVDYSLALYDHFQTLRSYRPTRLVVDPAGFEVRVAGREDYREEKIDLPPSWLRGFGQLQAALGMPSRRVTLPVETVYAVLAHLARHREKTGPRSVRFQLTPGRPPTLVLDPWGVAIPSHGPVYTGERAEEIKVWGRRRLTALARVLPLVRHVEVALLGSGLPSIWIADLDEMRFVLALSGWTTNDWTSGSNLELLTGGFRTAPEVLSAVRDHLETHHRATPSELAAAVSAPRDVLLGSLNLLAKQGQVMYDYAAGCYRYRPILPVALSDALIGPESPELTEARRIWREDLVTIEPEGDGPEEARRAGPASESLDGSDKNHGTRTYTGRAERVACEAVLDADGAFARAKCSCSHFFKNGLRAGPCRHLLALRMRAQGTATPRAANPDWLQRWFS